MNLQLNFLSGKTNVRKIDCLNNLQNRICLNSDEIILAIHFTKVDLRLSWWEHDAIEEGIIESHVYGSMRCSTAS